MMILVMMMIIPSSHYSRQAGPIDKAAHRQGGGNLCNILQYLVDISYKRYKILHRGGKLCNILQYVYDISYKRYVILQKNISHEKCS